MNLELIRSKDDFVLWFKEHLNRLNGIGSIWTVDLDPTEAAPDVTVEFEGKRVNFELAFLIINKRGIIWRLSKLQRQWHHDCAKLGKRTALLAIVNEKNFNTLILVRSDRIPLTLSSRSRDSGCTDGTVDALLCGKQGQDERDIILTMLEIVFQPDYWIEE